MNEKLFVERTIGKYVTMILIKEPDNIDELIANKKYNFDSLEQANDRNVIEFPMSHTEKRDCDLELDGNALKKIAVGPKTLEFGEIFKNSEQIRTFWIKNNLKTSIFIKIENNIAELKRR